MKVHPGSWLDDLRGRYSEPHRKYHTLEHINELLGHLEAARPLIERADLFELAIWYHDAVYEPTAPHGDNEKASAALFQAHWSDAPEITAGEMTYVREIILATIDHRFDATTHHADAALFLDADLAILGADEKRFDEYTAQVRLEYSNVPDRAYSAGRTRFLQDALDRQQLFLSPHFVRSHDARARTNMKRELNSLL